MNRILVLITIVAFTICVNAQSYTSTNSVSAAGLLYDIDDRGTTVLEAPSQDVFSPIQTIPVD